jgi:predicted methyltransferase MtxX (methanogen marker protein 4)
MRSEEAFGLIDLGALLERGCRSHSRVGIGLSGDSLEKTLSRLRSTKCSVRVEGFGDAHALMGALRSGELDAAVRGTLGSSAVVSEIKRSFGIGEVMRAAVMGSETPFILAPVGIDEGMDAASRLRIAENTLRYFARVGWKLRVGVLSKGRSEDRSRGDEIRRSLDDGDAIAASLKSKGHEARHFTILVEDAVRQSDLVLAPDGVSGNLMFRTLHFVGGAKALGAPVVNLDSVFVDTSRVKEDFSEPVMLAAALAEHAFGTHTRA